MRFIMMEMSIHFHILTFMRLNLKGKNIVINLWLLTGFTVLPKKILNITYQSLIRMGERKNRSVWRDMRRQNI
uniref:Uncharacterized protein n=1 Tax=Proteus sp. 3M TaxID=1232493 RepID=J9XVA6_9GAMM|nr:hypothetical protein [Proteus sp. 3M]